MTLSARLPDLRTLELFCEVLAGGSIGAAARAQDITQQSASARLRALEVQVGAVLLVRGPRGAAPTPAGVVLVEWAQRLLEVAGQVDTALGALREQGRSELSITASMTVAEHLVPGWLVALRSRQLRAAHAPTAVSLRATNTAAVVAAVREGTAQIGFTEGSQPPVGLSWRAVGQDELVAVVGPGHPWARRRGPVQVRDLVAAPLVCREVGSGTRQVLDEALAAAGHAPVVPLLELTTATAVREAVRAGAAAAVLSRLAVASDVAAGALVARQVAGVDLSRTLRAVWASGQHPPAGPARDLVALAAARRSTPGSAREPRLR
ncbi:LysR family transcriptional regulator [Quadrisphaera setariae]|uniref:LysR family transcriptional regulator n=1 Tax=Quadrisphaera setariae TaxID=2593304 RepID=A0A5C8Z2Z0_9ACTN|nr:LysR family transcriptional regulator [Quadrisphaera setariae]TXR52452.1 LysR family transcriptional regulator [Quadrisphaera setariae]